MKYINFILAAFILISSTTAASNGRCGKKYGSCPSGTCCSKYGYCGTSSNYCGVGCQVKYGLCSSNKNTTTKKTTTKKTSTKKTSINKTSTTKKSITTKKATTTLKPKSTVANLPISSNGMCGKEHGVCPGTSCCSKYGYCGVTSAHCGTGCNSEFGRCDGNESTIKTTSTTSKNTTKKTTSTTKTTKKAATTTVAKTSTNGRCGKEDGSCPNNQCCSVYGYCGKSTDHCGAGCQSEFGKCGSSSNDESEASDFEYHESCIKNNQWALTFDDGPYDYDDDLLDLLSRKKVKATFFINGANVMDIKSSKAKKIIQRMHKDGHIVASHTWSHSNISEISKNELIKEMTQLEDYIYKYIGKKPALMRPPYGAGNGDSVVAKTLKSLGYNGACMWNVDTLDWDTKGDIDYALSVFKKYLGKPILSLNHNFYGGITKDKLLKLIEAEIDYMHGKGYTTVTMDECLGLPAYQ